MGEIETDGPDALAFLQHLLSNDVAKLAPNGAQYSCLCREDGGVLDDLFTYRLGADRYLTVTNAANHDRDLAWFVEHAAGFDVEVRDVAAETAMLAVQGPGARELVAAHADDELPPRMRCQYMGVDGAPTLVCGTGYTGEAGVELLLDSGEAGAVWESLVADGAVPVGLAARDTLRLEVCFHLYGNDLMVERTPIEAGLGWACKEDTGFVGSAEIAARRAAGPAEKLIPFVIEGRGIARQGNVVMDGDRAAGEVTSGTMSPSMRVGIGMAYVRADLAEPGTELEIDVRGRRRRAVVSTKPLYDPVGG
jgi:aminomethyltransferase